MVLLILTSHRSDCFSLAIDCLEQHTDLGEFERILVIANALTPEHRQLAQCFVHRNTNAELIECAPRGIKTVMPAIDMALARYIGRMVVKIDEDVFVMPGWLNGLRQAYLLNKSAGCGLVSALVPNNGVGRAALHNYMCAIFPEYANSPELHSGKVGPAYGVWVWRMILEGKLNPAAATQGGHIRMQRITIKQWLSINCVLMDPEFLSLAMPFSRDVDEYLINLVLRHPQSPFFGILAPGSLAHHYSFYTQQKALDAAIPVSVVRNYLLESSITKRPIGECRSRRL